uniref:MARVEL domain-containing protein n=1 Tax=Ascaris lumbricoides TaxID=6252 RepID=A0A0M3HQA2_ASCLU
MADPGTFLRFPHIFKPLQSMNAVVLTICLGSASSVPGNGIVWFIVISSLVVSVFATVIFALDVQDQFMTSISNASIPWDLFELIYSFVFSILSAVSVWLCFSYIKLVPDNGRFGGYVAAGCVPVVLLTTARSNMIVAEFQMFMLLHVAFYAIPTFLLYDKSQVVQRDTLDPLAVRSQDPFQETPYQSQA